MVKRNIVHIEIPTLKASQSADFYAKLFGWHIQHHEGLDYTMWEPQEGVGGGFSPVEMGATAGEVMIFVNSEDIDADLQQAASLGGTILRQKEEIPTVGWWGVFKDPSGNAIALFTSLQPRA
jgi:predicted enzyme related to lactoylglutathione lyase